MKMENIHGNILDQYGLKTYLLDFSAVILSGALDRKWFKAERRISYSFSNFWEGSDGRNSFEKGG